MNLSYSGLLREQHSCPAAALDFPSAAFDLAPFSFGFAGHSDGGKTWPISLSPTALIKVTRITHSAALTRALPDVPGKRKVPVRTTCFSRPNNMAASSTI